MNSVYCGLRAKNNLLWGCLKPLQQHPFGNVTSLMNCRFQVNFHTCGQLTYSEVITSDQNRDPSILQSVSKSSATALRIKKISKAMKAYLERAKNHDIFLTTKNDEFEIGKQHLANMMGLDAGMMTQEDIDKAIQYLMPSGLYQPKAWPLMKPPEELFPKEKAAQFDVSGRPFSPFFFTGKANFYKAMHEIVGKFHELDALEDKMLRKGISKPPEEYQVDLSGGEWLSIDDLKVKFIENIAESEYDFIITSLTRLSEHPYAFRCRDHIWQYRKDFPNTSALETLPDLMYDDNGRPYMETMGSRKSARSKVTVWGNGSGKIEINGKDIAYFHRLDTRDQILFPLALTGLLGKVDVHATVEFGGPSAQSGAIRYAMSMCLRCFVSEECRERMRVAGLLTLDIRKKERQKPGRRRARALKRWRKR